jgi:hypothetical protein
MSRIEEAQRNYDELSSAASEHARKLCYVGFALIAIFSGVQGGALRFPLDIPNQLVWAGLLLGIALGLDLLQYVVATALWGAWARKHEKNGREPAEFPRAINWPALAFFWLKIVATIAGWVALLEYIVPVIW